MKSRRGLGSDPERADLYRRCQWALVASLDRRPISRLNVVDDEPFPIPGED